MPFRSCRSSGRGWATRAARVLWIVPPDSPADSLAYAPACCSAMSPITGSLNICP
jgi:hypothetical protein